MESYKKTSQIAQRCLTVFPGRIETRISSEIRGSEITENKSSKQERVLDRTYHIAGWEYMHHINPRGHKLARVVPNGQKRCLTELPARGDWL